jgi:hypothetical protein
LVPTVGAEDLMCGGSSIAGTGVPTTPVGGEVCSRDVKSFEADVR